MKALLHKEARLALHPTAWLFLLLSSMLLIPNYPYYVIFFYTGLAVFFTCLNGRENHDVFYTMLLPVRKADVVRSRFAAVVLLELAQIAAAIPFAVLRQHLPLPPNAVGMDANVALFGLSFGMLGLFNLVFFGIYYRDVQKVGKAFVVSSAVTFLYIAAAETMAHTVPFLRDRLDTPDAATENLPAKLAVLAAGLAAFCLLTALACRRAIRAFERQDL